ncbi:spore germination protein [Cytobacillus sp. FSL R5-0569]|uniref:spore germination protein n=1 Tax=Cytobacillus sp. FSL R5-0569 TaxID=2921649 RepID=UPI0030F8D8C2
MKTQLNNKKRLPKTDKLDEQYLRQQFAINGDVQFVNYSFQYYPQPGKVVVLFSEVMIDKGKLSEALGRLEESFLADRRLEEKREENEQLLMYQVNVEEEDKESIAEDIYSGMVFVLVEELDKMFKFELPQIPNRSPEESNSELSFRGPRDGFVEDLHINLALIRKRYKTSTLVNEAIEIGVRGKTKISLLYVKDIIKEQYVIDLKSQLAKIETDVIISTTDLEEVLSGKYYTLFPLFNYTGRPDNVVANLDLGRFVIIVDGCPTVMVGPTTLFSVLKTPEDRFTEYYYTNMQMFFRLTGLVISSILPGFYVAMISFHMDQLPFPFLATITVSRMGLPLSTPLEAFLVLALFELFKEAGNTLPRAIGQTLTVVGGLIIGDAAIRGGLTAPTMLVIAGVTSVAAYTLVNQSLGASLSLVRFFILLFSAVLGLFGFFISIFSVILYLSRLEMFGLPYLAPLSPLSFKDTFASILEKPYLLRKKRSSTMRPKDDTKGRLK